MMLSGHQPVYLPGIQLFNKITLSDCFMFTGRCQYSHKSWQKRNYIKTGMLSMPISSLGLSINETVIGGGVWRKKHIKSLELAYGKSEFFEDYFPEVKEIIEYPWNGLASLNECLIELFMDWLDIMVPTYCDTWVEGHKTDMLISMCRVVGADQYLSNEGARAYVDEVKMAEAGITHHWQKFTPPDYGQSKNINDGQLSVLDLLFMKGPGAAKIVRECGYVG